MSSKQGPSATGRFDSAEYEAKVASLDLAIGEAVRTWGQLLSAVSYWIIRLADGPNGSHEVGLAVLPYGERDRWKVFRDLYRLRLVHADEETDPTQNLNGLMTGLFKMWERVLRVLRCTSLALLERLLRAASRPHRSLSLEPPTGPRAVPPLYSRRNVVSEPVLEGLHHVYRWAA